MSKTKYPIVLVHGIMVKNLKIWRAFRVISNAMVEDGYTVYVTDQDGVGAIQTNAQQIKEEILAILQKEKCEKVNIIAHSKGGLDSRYMISKLGMDDKIASLTTLSTPHHGSKMSTTLMKIPKFFAKIIAFFCNTAYKIAGDKKPDLYACGVQLSDTTMVEFNKDVPNSDKVYYQSYSSKVDTRKAFVQFIPFQFCKICEKRDVDGVVAVESAIWGDYKGSIHTNPNHTKMVGAYGSKRHLKDVCAFYCKVAKDLEEMGF